MMGNLVHNERVKLRAVFSNNVALASIIGGVVIPTLSQAGQNSFWKTTVTLVAAAVLAVLAQGYAQWTLGRLKE
jgi:hypothetical protein